MAYTTLTKVNDVYTAQNASIVDSILRNATIMQAMYFKPASHGNVDKFRAHSTEPTVTEVNAGSGLTSTAIDGTLTSLNLAILQSLASEPAVLVNQYPLKGLPTSYESYFLERQPIYLKTIAKSFENKVLYGTTSTTQFDGLLATATANSTVTDKGATAGAGTDIFVWRMEEDNSHGLYNEKLVSEGNLVDFKWVPGKGMTQMVTQLDGTSIECYSGVYSSALGLKIVSSGYVSAIEGIDATHKPTLADVEKALLQANSYLAPSETMIICSPTGYTYLKEVLGGTLQRVSNNDNNNVSNTIEMYNGVRIVISSRVNDAR